MPQLQNHFSAVRMNRVGNAFPTFNLRFTPDAGGVWVTHPLRRNGRGFGND